MATISFLTHVEWDVTTFITFEKHINVNVRIELLECRHVFTDIGKVNPVTFRVPSC